MLYGDYKKYDRKKAKRLSFWYTVSCNFGEGSYWGKSVWHIDGACVKRIDKNIIKRGTFYGFRVKVRTQEPKQKPDNVVLFVYPFLSMEEAVVERKILLFKVRDYVKQKKKGYCD